MPQKGNKSDNTPRRDTTPDKGKNAAVASKTYKEKEKEKAEEKVKTPQIRIEGVRYDVPNKQVGQKTFAEIVAKNPTVSLSDLKETIADEGYRLNEKAKDYFHTNKNVLNQPTEEKEKPKVTYDPFAGDDGDIVPPPVGAGPFEWMAYKDIAIGGLQKSAQTESETIRGKYNKEIAEVQRGQSDYAQDAETKRSLYSDDSEERWRTFASTADKEKAIEVQKIVAAGLKDVAEIEGSYSVKGIQAKGEADERVMALRAQADKDISRMDNTSRMYSLLGLAFG
jgi:hypothetical protein